MEIPDCSIKESVNRIISTSFIRSGIKVTTRVEINERKSQKERVKSEFIIKGRSNQFNCVKGFQELEKYQAVIIIHIQHRR